MIIVPDLSKVFCMSKFCFRYSYALLLIIPAVFFIIWIMRKNFIKFSSKEEQAIFEEERRKIKKITLITRILIFSVLLIAISAPYLMESRLIKGNPRLTILTDDSKSFEMFDKNAGNDLLNKIKGKVPVDLRTICSNENSAIGNGILNNLEGGENVLVITDGNNNKGKLLGDVILFASSINSTVSTIELNPEKSDVGVSIEGPYEVIKDTEANYFIKVKNVGDERSYTLEISLDNEIIYSEKHSGSINKPFSKLFSEGAFHKMSAEIKDISGKDHFKQNNKYLKTIKVAQRPSVLFVSKKTSPLLTELKRLYDITTKTSIPEDLSEYMTVILNDIHANEIIPRYDALYDYAAEKGNGLVVIGGQNSYDRGGYKEAKIIEPLLPVKIGSGEESEKSDTQVVVVVDLSGTTTEVINEDGQVEVRDFDKVIKALAASVLESLKDNTNVGVVVVGTPSKPYVGVVSEIKNLKSNKKDLIDRISKLNGGGQSFIEDGIKQASNMLMKAGGGKNIILISDGRGLAETPMLNTRNAVRQAAAKAIKTYVVGVGAKEKQEIKFLSDIAIIGNGIYWPANANNKLKIIFGEPDKQEEEFYNTLSVIDNVHFITNDIDLDAVISGYNYVVPKSAARLLVSTNKNIPIISVWRFGLGRIVSISTDDGGKWSGEMLDKKNSVAITRSINWAIGNLGRKKEFDVRILDTTVGNPTYVNVISKDLPKHEKLFFTKTDVNNYNAEFASTEAGFYNFLGADVAVNYDKEYLNLGINKEFINLINATGGKVFKKNDLDNIIGFVIEKSRRIKVQSTNLAWPFVLVVLIIFLLEITLRRLWENKIFR